jgi:hypothetical protein
MLLPAAQLTAWTQGLLCTAEQRPTSTKAPRLSYPVQPAPKELVLVSCRLTFLCDLIESDITFLTYRARFSFDPTWLSIRVGVSDVRLTLSPISRQVRIGRTVLYTLQRVASRRDQQHVASKDMAVSIYTMTNGAITESTNPAPSNDA